MQPEKGKHLLYGKRRSVQVQPPSENPQKKQDKNTMREFPGLYDC